MSLFSNVYGNYNNYLSGALITLLGLHNSSSHFQDSPIIIDGSKITAEIQPEMWGVFFEDINFSADGGLFAELIKNRSFEFNEPMMGWKEIKEPGSSGKILIMNKEQDFPASSRFMRIQFHANNGRYGIENEGFRGIGVHNNSELRFSITAKKCSTANTRIDVELLSSAGEIIGKINLGDLEEEWFNHSVIFTAQATDPKCSLRILLSGEGTIDLEMVSLFPVNTWKRRPNGLRNDLVQMIADLKPGFIRFPGGCIVEGYDLSTRYKWKNTIGPYAKRKLMINRWNSEFSHRPAPDYYQSFGLGFFEYFQLAEDIGAEPLPIINCGMACQFNTAEVAAEEHLTEYIQDALDLIEFANGNINTKWGRVRAAMGHEKPFNMKYLGVGNEQWGEQYITLYKYFAAALRKSNPEIKLIVSAGPGSDGEEFDYLWKQHRELNSDIVDEHYYNKPEWFLNNAGRYDKYTRNGPKVFAGEYAAQSVAVCSPDNKNTWLCALSEAAFMTGLERNADVVRLASYAPLLAHSEAWQWTPDLIYFDNLNSFASANYHVQKLFSNNKGTYTVSITNNKLPLKGQDSIYASACIDKKTSEVIIKIVNASHKPIERLIIINGVKLAGNEAEAVILSNTDLNAYNTMSIPDNIKPVNKKIKLDGEKFAYLMDSYSFTVLKIKIK